VDERFLPDTRDLVLYMQFASLQFYDKEPVGRWVGEGFVDFVFKCLVPFLKFRKMRLDRHVACLLASDC
jgi:hypothetical protein